MSRKTDSEAPWWIASRDSGLDEVIEEAKTKACSFANMTTDFSAESRMSSLKALEALAHDLSTMVVMIAEYKKKAIEMSGKEA